MKRVRVLRDMPFAEAGSELEVCNTYVSPDRDGENYRDYVHKDSLTLDVKDAIKDGWLEYVEEDKSL